MTYSLAGSQGPSAKAQVLVAGKFAKTPIQPRDGKAGPLQIQLPDGEPVEQKNSILKYLARVSQAGLYGDSHTDDAQIDSWLEWCSLNLENNEDLGAIKKYVEDVLEPQLKLRTFLVTERCSIADIAISCSLVKKIKSISKEKNPATYRWFNTCLNMEPFRQVFDAADCPPVQASPVRSDGADSSPKQAQPLQTGGGKTQHIEMPVSTTGGPPPRPLLLNAPYSNYNCGGRVRIAGILEAPDKGASMIGETITACGWVKTMRLSGEKLAFIEVNDGSGFDSLQVVANDLCTGFADMKKLHTGASVKCTGKVVKSQGQGQAVELMCKEAGTAVKVLGYNEDPSKYPLAKKQHSVEFLREHAHLRPRSNIIGAVARVRNALAKATHDFFQSRGFLYVHTPLITSADCEGAGEMFQITTLLSQAKDKVEGIPKRKEDGKVDYAQDFFSKPTFLTVSGQLSVENYCCALSDVYTFGPTFRAENSHTSRHLAEFWMIEPELAFADLYDVMDCAEDYLKFCIRAVFENHKADLEFFDDRIEKGLIKRLENLLDNPFGRLSYTEAIEVLQKEEKMGKKFEVKVEWGIDLGSEHERFLAEKIYNKPVIVYNYPSNIKAFYMRRNEDGKTCCAMDILCPNVGEVVGGSQREERLTVLDDVIKELGLDPQEYWWYRELRKYGTVPHGGFGLGFERLIMLCTGIENIRDTIPFPRYPGRADF